MFLDAIYVFYFPSISGRTCALWIFGVRVAKWNSWTHKGSWQNCECSWTKSQSWRTFCAESFKSKKKSASKLIQSKVRKVCAGQYHVECRGASVKLWTDALKEWKGELRHKSGEKHCGPDSSYACAWDTQCLIVLILIGPDTWMKCILYSVFLSKLWARDFFCKVLSCLVNSCGHLKRLWPMLSHIVMIFMQKGPRSDALWRKAFAKLRALQPKVKRSNSRISVKRSNDPTIQRFP